jgi:cytochrome c peroxidase
MRITTILSIFVIASLVVIATGCGAAPEKASVDPAKLKLFKAAPDSVPPKDGAITPEKVALGKMLYYDTRLSRSQKISCNSCHDLAKYGVDGTPVSNGHKGQKGDRNAPTVYNAAGHFVQFWDGRAKDVEEQAKGPVLNPVEMAMKSDKEVVATLKSMPEYVDAFKKAFPEDKDPVTYDNLGKAIGAFERKLITASRWDKYLNGDENALTAEEKAGLAAFINSGCVTCHAGTYLGGNMFQKAGAVKPWPSEADPGRFKVTKNDADKMMFKVPSLRNIDKTAPYFHDGKTATLADAIAKMGEYQVGKTLSDADVKSIETFLKALTGDIPADYIKAPELPKSTAKTPKPSEAD